MRLLAEQPSRLWSLSPLGGSGAVAADRFIEAAKRFLGQPYRWGGGHSSKTGVMPVDCSGLVLQAARMIGLNFDGTAATQQKMGEPVPMDQLQPGDLLFKGRPASHVGIYLGNGQFIHAPRTGDVVKIDSVARYGSFDSARRVFDAPARPAPDAPAASPASAPDAFVAASPAPRRPGPGGTHTVAQGDTLWRIAERTLGDRSRWREIYELNRDRLPSPYLAYPGMQLRLPGGAEAPVAAAPTPAPAAPPSFAAQAAAPATAAPSRVAALGTANPWVQRRLARLAPASSGAPTLSERLRAIMAGMRHRA